MVTSAMLVLSAVALAGCKTASRSDITGSIGKRGSLTDDAGRASGSIDQLAERYRSNPKDAVAANAYGQALRATGQRAQAVAVYEQASIASPGNRMLLAGYGRALADNGALQRGFDVLSSAHSPADPDWRLLSAQGAVLDQMGRHEEARGYYANALKMRPEEASILSNLGLSYMLSKDLPRAESHLRRAQAQPTADRRVRQNLGLVVGLQGRFQEAEAIVRADLPPEEAASNVAYLKQMLGQSADAAQAAGRRS